MKKNLHLFYSNAFSRLLYSVLPPSVANELRHQRPVPAKKYECVTLLFSGVVGFNDYCAKNADSNGAMKIVKLLNNLYTTFDVLTDPVKNPNVYKVQREHLDTIALTAMSDTRLEAAICNFR